MASLICKGNVTACAELEMGACEGRGGGGKLTSLVPPGICKGRSSKRFNNFDGNPLALCSTTLRTVQVSKMFGFDSQ